MRIGGVVWPKLINAPLEHMGAKVPVVTTSTFSAISLGEDSFAICTTSSAVKTTACPLRILALISSMVFMGSVHLH
uniref:Uncharacterized protein n=1 Tax=Coprothermobacter proteolyticus (strain ATCC 35245 / DSM 5265 / OCM 4 / BT) TaxID=309798 RepID=B5Y6J0_COPPD